MNSPLNEYWITSDIFENDVRINFSYDPNNIINEMVHLLSLEDVERLQAGVSADDYSYDFKAEYVSVSKHGFFCDISISLPGMKKSWMADTEALVLPLAEYIRECRSLQAERMR